MTYYFATEATIPLRRNPAESAEMISQLLFGDIALCLEREGNWMKLRNTEDSYEGWASSNMLTALAQEEVDRFTAWHYIRSPQAFLEAPGGLLRLPLGVRIPKPGIDGSFHIAGSQYRIPWPVDTRLASTDEIPRIARGFLYTPYLWGGRSGFGIDCSGLAQGVFRICGISLPRDSSQQYLQGKEVSFQDRIAGDLAFFSKPNKDPVSHVGIVDEKGKLIHASGRVRVDPMTPEGLFHPKTKELSHRLLGLKRYHI